MKDKLDALTDRLRVKENFMLQPAALNCILEKLAAIRPIRIGICHALLERNCSFCTRLCATGRGLKYQMAYKKANRELSRHLDIRNLVKLSLDVKSFKDTLLRPQQRMLFSKQARRVVALEAESSSVCSVDSADEEYSERVYFERRQAELLQWKFESEMDKKLILGVMDQHVELVEERRASVM